MTFHVKRCVVVLKYFNYFTLKFMLYQLSFLALTQHIGNQNVLKDTFYAGVVLIAAFYDFFAIFFNFNYQINCICLNIIYNLCITFLFLFR